MTFSGGRGAAPGVFVYEDAVPVTSPVASFNTTYMLVAAPAETSVTVFPNNRPIAITSLAEYENLIGSLPSNAGQALTSYHEVRAFFQQAVGADLRVTRVGTPANITQLGFNPASSKDNGVDAPTALQKGDVVYLKLKINDIELGETDLSGAWLGVPVTIPENYVAGDATTNLLISVAMRDAAKAAIEANVDISSSVYIREEGTGDPSCSECAYLDLSGRIFNAPVEVVNTQDRTGNQFIFSTNAYVIAPVTETDTLTIYDYLQCVSTAFNGTDLPQGYLCAPAAFQAFTQVDRVNLGQRMEELCSDSNHKWMAVVDCGPFDVTTIEKYSAMTEADVANGFETGDQYLVENVVYEWTDTDDLIFTEASYSALDTERGAILSTNSTLPNGTQRALQDDMTVRMNAAANVGTNVITITEDWPLYAKTSGTMVTVSLASVTPAPTPPTYTDADTGVTTAVDLLGTFYVIAKDVDTSLSDTQIKLASTRTRALANTSVDIITGGSPSAGVLLVMKYATPAWSFDVELGGKVSNTIEVSNNNGASFNTQHLPATLQKETSEFDFEALVRQLTTPNRTIFTGGVRQVYLSSAQTDATTDTFTVVSHGFTTGDQVNLFQIPGATVPGGFSLTGSGSVNATLFVIRVDANSFQLATSEANAIAGTEITITTTGTNAPGITAPGGEAAYGIISTGGDLQIFCADHKVQSGNTIYFDSNIGTAADGDYLTSTTRTTTRFYYANRIDKNVYELAQTASDLAANVFINMPAAALTTTVATRFYRKLETATLPDGTFAQSPVIRGIRGRKYRVDATLAVFGVMDESGSTVSASSSDPYGGTYTEDVSTDLRLSNAARPEPSQEFFVNASTITVGGGGGVFSIQSQPGGANINIPFVTGEAVVINQAIGGVLPTDGGDPLFKNFENGRTYYAIVEGTTTMSIAESPADAFAGQQVEPSQAGANNGDSVCFQITAATNQFTYQYTEDDQAMPLSDTRDFAGDNNFYCVPLSGGQQGNDDLTEVFFNSVLQEGSTHTVLYGSDVEFEFVQPTTEVPNALFNFAAVTGRDVMDEALRGVNNNGVPQVVVVEEGLDSHSKLFAESQKYSTTQGFLAYFAPYLYTDLAFYIPPSGFVTGFAMKRYRDEIAGFKLPPAGTKYALAGARGVQVEITSAMQDVSAPFGLNALRQLPGYSETDPATGITYGPVFIWGSRTRINPRNAEQSLYKFVNTRVIMNVIYGTLRQSLDSEIFNIIDGRAVVFNQIRTLISTVLYSNFYVPGALFGASAADAFDVIVDDRNNPAANLENGLVNVKVFVVPVPTLERIEIDLVRVPIGQITEVEAQLGFSEA